MTKSKSIAASDLAEAFAAPASANRSGYSDDAGVGEAFVAPASAKVFRGSLPPQVKIEVGDVVYGYFQGMKTVSMQDQNTHEAKEVRVYTFRDKQAKKFAILGRTMLDSTFDELFDAYQGLENTVGLIMKIERLEDTRLSKGRTLGNYDILCWEEWDK